MKVRKIPGGSGPGSAGEKGYNKMRTLNNVEVMIYRSALFDKIFVPYAVKIQRWYRGLVLIEEVDSDGEQFPEHDE